MITKWNDKQLMDAARLQGEKQVKGICYMIEREAKHIVPYDTGHLKRSITIEVETKEKEIVGRVGTNTDYAAFVELGTRKMAARPYLRPAFYAVVGFKQGTVTNAYDFEQMVADFVRTRG